MSSNFLNGLADQLSSQYGSPQTNALNVLQNGSNSQYQTLGDYSQQFAPMTERKYLEEGYLRLDPYNVLPKAFEVLFQEPDVTILVKKRAFSTLAENHRIDYMDADEKLFYKASKILFQNKCKQISALEKLSKIERIGEAAGQLDSQLLPLIFSLIDEVSPGFSNSPLAEENDFLDSQASEPFKKLTSVVNEIRKVYVFSATNYTTTWITDNTNIFKSDFSQGTGVIEITNATNISTHTSLGLARGTFSLDIVDPYKAMTITNSDIEWALSDAMNIFDNSAIFQLGKASLDKVAADAMGQFNSARRSRGASPVEFIINDTLSPPNQVSAVIDAIGETVNFTYSQIAAISTQISNNGVTVSPESLRGGPLVEENGLDPQTEVPLFSAVISAIYASIQFKQTSQTNVSQNSKLTNYARQKLRLHYGGKTIIQVMDQVHIYIGTKSRTDNRIMAGLQNMFSGLGFLQKLNTTVFDLKNQVSTLFNPSQNIDLQLEKYIYVGSNFPTSLWVMMRNMFINDKNGCHVFGGVVEQARRRFDSSSGRWVVSVSGADNAKYLDYGVVNLKPGVDQFNGPLYDPLTPFETKFDAVSSNYNNQKPVLLPENQAILNQQTLSSGLMRYTSGRNAGQPVTADNFFEDKELSGNGISRNIYYAPSGLVYKWKEGIGTLVQFGDSFSRDNIQLVGVPITNNPLAGQNIMNVISLFITGIPYDYATYYKAVNDFDKLSRNPQSGQSGAGSFYKGLTNSLKQNNALWGDFIPFKNLVVDEQTFTKVLDSTTSINNANTQINGLLQQIQDTTNKLYILQKGGANISAASNQISLLQNSLTILNSQVTTQKQAITNTLSNSAVPMSLIGSDVSYDPSQLQTSQSFSLSSPKTRRELRRTVNFLTRRVQWQVRSNEDKNLFIVDDSYDKDYDQNAFEQSLVGQLAQYSTEYDTVRSKVESVASLLSLEVFCDTQGHIRARPQQYNRVPSSVFYRMLQLKQQTGIQIFPQFLEDLFITNIKALVGNIKVVEDQIRLDGAILGLNNDAAVSSFVTSPAITGNDNTDFEFVSDDTDGVITNVAGIVEQNNPDTTTSNNNNAFVDKLNAQNSVTSVFTTNKRATVIQNISNNSQQFTTTLSSDRINVLKTRLLQETGQQPVIDNFQQTSINSVIATPTNMVDVFKLTKDLSDKLSQRQKLIKQASGAIKNAREALSLDSNNSTTANELLFPNLYGNKDVPEMFENMIEDEAYDDYGPGSGGRYVIHNYQIRSYEIDETPPEYVTIEVSGLIDPLLGNETLPGLNSFPQGGNGQITGAAVDYDLWRMYGYRQRSSIQAPFLSDPKTQCAPYAASLLSRARRNILNANLTISGNEYMQPGEVIYIEEEDKLFYVESVSHSFTYGGNFTTTMTLTYGHNPGEYIPTPLDVIGKMLYNVTAPAGSNYVNYKQDNVFNESPLGTIIINSSSTGLDGILGGNYGEFNSKIINNILYTAASALNNNPVTGSNVTPMLELRIYYDSKAGGVNSTLSSQVSNLISILTGSASIDTQFPNTSFSSTISAKAIQDPKKTQINISDPNEYRSPTQQAWDLARNAANSATSAPPLAITDAQQAQTTIFSVIIDCIMAFNNTNNSANTGTSSNTNTGNSTSGGK